MRIIDLEIHNIRGIKDLKLFPNGQNLVIWGPNGSGKSAVVDAVDFLLTGKITRLLGEGTGGISLKAHGPHIDHEPKEAWVKAQVMIPGHSRPIPLERFMSSPSELLCSPEDRKLIEPVLQLASLGQHVLSRREILRYVAAEAGKRAAEVQALLNLSELEETRKAFGRVSNNAKTELVEADKSLKTARSTIQSTLDLTQFDSTGVVSATNALRSILGGQPLFEIASENLKEGLAVPTTQPRPTSVNLQNLAKAKTEIANALASLETSIKGPDVELRGLLKELRANKAALNEVAKLNLMKMGITQIQEDGNCPLCGITWEPGRLREHLESHILRAKTASEKLAKIQNIAFQMSNVASKLQSQIMQISYAADHLKMPTDSFELSEWRGKLTRFLDALTDPLSRYPGTANEIGDVSQLFAPKDVEAIVERIVSEAILKMPQVSPEQSAWDTLTSLRENWKQYEKAGQRRDRANLFRERSRILENHFEASRDHTLGNLYSTIESRFSELYKLIHEDDEPTFATTIRPVGAGLAFEVDFYGRGKFPPLALHSEGHQDTMGLCLYLVLAERLTRNIIELTILDDVVMSVDSGHRRKVCELLASQFPGRQFLITTHDRTWARQLVTMGVVSKTNSVEFTRWSLEVGPSVSIGVIDAVFWEKIDSEIGQSDIPSAAARLRRGAEGFFEQACDSLRANIRYRTDNRWELSEFVNAAIGTYRKLLKEAKDAANSWNDKELVQKLQEAESVAAQIISRSKAEEWGINENVHYNRWGEFEADDFRPVSEAWRDLTELFRCSLCDGLLFLSMEGHNPSLVRCKCGKVNWNLMRKPRPQAPGTPSSN